MPADPDQAVGIDSTKLATLLAAVGAAVGMILNWFRTRREDKEKADVNLVEQYKVMLADMTKASDAAKAEHAAYKADTERQLIDLRNRLAEVVSQVHYLRLYLAQNGIKMPPKWNPDDDSALFRSLDAKEIP